MLDNRITLKRPWLAGILAFLLPGAGHLYQGRYFKAGLYFVCILGLFFTGMTMAEWQAVQPPEKSWEKARGTALLKFAAQSAVGVPALFGLVQRERYSSPANVPVTTLSRSMEVPVEGMASYLDETGNLTGAIIGKLSLQPSPGQFGKNSITGTFSGTMDGAPISLQLSDHVELARPIEASKSRAIAAGIRRERDGRSEEIGHLRGEIPRSFWNWFEVPMDAAEEEDLHRRLGKFHELALVFTWIAGLLNVLAIWDAVEGPAYGYGDEHHPEAVPAPANG